MCICYTNGAGQLVVCDQCASQQIEALNTPVLGQVETLTPQECDGLTSTVTNFFVQLQSRGGHQ